MAEQPPGILTIFAQALIDLISLVTGGIGSASARRRAKRDARKAEQEARAQRRQWLELVEGQKVRGKAGNASEQQAREALRGNSGRANPLDSRSF